MFGGLVGMSSGDDVSTTGFSCYSFPTEFGKKRPSQQTTKKEVTWEGVNEERDEVVSMPTLEKSSRSSETFETDDVSKLEAPSTFGTLDGDTSESQQRRLKGGTRSSTYDTYDDITLGDDVFDTSDASCVMPRASCVVIPDICKEQAQTSRKDVPSDGSAASKTLKCEGGVDDRYKCNKDHKPDTLLKASKGRVLSAKNNPRNFGRLVKAGAVPGDRGGDAVMQSFDDSEFDIPTPEPGEATELHELIEIAGLTPIPGTPRFESNPHHANRGRNRWQAVSEHLLANPHEATAVDTESRTPLSLLAEWGSDVPLSLVHDVLICNPRAASTPDIHGRFPIHYYVSSNKDIHSNSHRSPEVLALLIQFCPVALVRRDVLGNTPLAAAMQSTGEYGPDGRVNTKTKKMVALSKSAILRTLIDANPTTAAIPNEMGSFPLHCVGKDPHIAMSVLKSLLECYPDAVAEQNEAGFTPLALTIFWDGPLDVIELLLGEYPLSVHVRDASAANAITYAWNLFVHHVKADTEEEDERERERVHTNRRIMNEAESPHDLDQTAFEWWEKMELLVRVGYYDTIEDPLPNEEKIRILHATCGLDVPPEMVRFALKMYRRQMFIKDEKGRLPIHIAAATPLYIKQPFEKFSKEPIVCRLLRGYPRGVAILDGGGRLPLHIAAEAGKTWATGGISNLVKAEPRAVHTRDLKTHMYPFMLAATRNPSVHQIDTRQGRAERLVRNFFDESEWVSLSWHQKEIEVHQLMEEEELAELDTVYRLLRIRPEVISCGIPEQAGKQFVLDREKQFYRKVNEKLRKRNRRIKESTKELEDKAQQKADEDNERIKVLEAELRKLKEIEKRKKREKGEHKRRDMSKRPRWRNFLPFKKSTAEYTVSSSTITASTSGSPVEKGWKHKPISVESLRDTEQLRSSSLGVASVSADGGVQKTRGKAPGIVRKNPQKKKTVETRSQENLKSSRTKR